MSVDFNLQGLNLVVPAAHTFSTPEPLAACDVVSHDRSKTVNAGLSSGKILRAVYNGTVQISIRYRMAYSIHLGDDGTVGYVSAAVKSTVHGEATRAASHRNGKIVRNVNKFDTTKKTR